MSNKVFIAKVRSFFEQTSYAKASKLCLITQSDWAQYFLTIP